MNTHHSSVSPCGRRYRQIYGTGLALLLGLGTIPALTASPVWMIKSHWDSTYSGHSSLPPTTLIRYDEDTEAVAEIGLLQIEGMDVDLNGLAMSPDGTLHAFELIGSPEISGSRLVTIDPLSRAVTPVGQPLPGVVIRGACCDPVGNLIGIDAKNQKLHVISPAGVVEKNVSLALPIGPENGYDYDADITRLGDGRYVLSAYRENPNRTVYYQINLTTGDMEEIGADEEEQEFDPYGPEVSVYILGLASSPSDPARLIGLDGNGQEDLLGYRLPDFSRTLLSANVPPVPYADAGGGDLAAAVVVLPSAEITVYQGKGADKNMEDNKSTRDFGTVRVGKTSKAMVFTIKNDGTAGLAKLRVSLEGKQAKDFMIDKKPARSVAPGKSTKFKVAYKPGKAKVSKATLHIVSNDKDENPFRVKLVGKGVK